MSCLVVNTPMLPVLCSDLSENKLEDLPPQVGDCTSLTRLDLHTNKLQALPWQISKLTNLKQISLHCNELKVRAVMH